ncbi:GNAT family N-acetyltransferase [Mycetocola sp. 2940]|uniref:GNAT family N-acetyltransferase n=1 Tax=Mycetocola sp. 2940 TaxID=3156452 RepID=UPI00339586AB
MGKKGSSSHGAPDGESGATVEVALSDLEPALVKDVYYRLLVPAFRPEELSTLNEIEETYCGPGTDPSVVVLKDGTPVAVMLGEWYADQRVLLLAYLSVNQRARGLGLGAHLVSEVLTSWCNGKEDVLVLAEVDDPRTWPGSDEAGEPHARLRFYDRWGARVLPVQYFQPSLRPGSPRVEGMLLLRLDKAPSVTGELLAAFLEEYFTVCEGLASLRDPRVAHLLASARDLDLDREAWPISRWAELPTS